ncbi:MAG: dephospho-CoA kinase [Eubacterium sp.]|nr:dephospho-CoA kinase [Eubacterium sp.]
MKIIGITGGIGSGKSYVLNLIKEKAGTFVIEADKLAHELMQPGQVVYENVLATFGNEIITDDKSIDRAYLRTIVMNDEEKLAKLNSIVHPAVKEYIKKDIEEKRASGDVKFYVIEAALLIQDNYREICDEIWYVMADLEVRIERLVKDRGYSREAAEEIISNQPDEEYYANNSDIMIENNGSQFLLEASLSLLFDEIKDNKPLEL